MDISYFWDKFKKDDGLTRSLGIEFINTPDPDTLQAKMLVCDKNKQPFGVLAGGASLSMAENLTGVGSMAVCPGYIAVGINVNGTHVKPAYIGDVVTAYGKLIHKGKTLHVWHVDIKNQNGELISTIQVTCLLYTSTSPRDLSTSRMPSSA